MVSVKNRYKNNFDNMFFTLYEGLGRAPCFETSPDTPNDFAPPPPPPAAAAAAAAAAPPPPPPPAPAPVPVSRVSEREL